MTGGNIGKSTRARVSAGVVAFVGLVGAAPATAQDATVYGTAGLDGYGNGIALLGTSVRAAGYGLKPVASLQTYYLQYDTDGAAGTATNSVWTVSPAVGVGYRTREGAVEAKVGYSFQNEDVDVPVLFGGGGDRVTTSLSAQYWGGGAPELEGRASYNWGSEYIWSQAQASVPVLRVANGGAVNLGGEVTWQGGVAGDEGSSSAISVGPLVKWSNGRNLTISSSAGWKDSNFDSPTWYGQVYFARYGLSF